MAKFIEYVPDYILRNYVKVGQTVTVLATAQVHVQVPKMPTPHGWDYVLDGEKRVQVVNFLPGYTEVYAKDGKFPVHNHQIVWTEKDGWEYHSTDINNVKEVRDAKD